MKKESVNAVKHSKLRVSNYYCSKYYCLLLLFGFFLIVIMIILCASFLHACLILSRLLLFSRKKSAGVPSACGQTQVSSLVMGSFEIPRTDRVS
jgi:hypothetical protein